MKILSRKTAGGGRGSKGVRALVLAFAGSAVLAVLGGITPASAATDPGTRVWEVGGSNMGECSAYLGQMQVRDDVNQIIRQYGDVLNIDNPGQIFHVRAQQPESLPPAQECLKRSF